MRLCGNGENGLSQKLSEHKVGEEKVIFKLKPLDVHKGCKLCGEKLKFDCNLTRFLDASFIMHQRHLFLLQAIQTGPYRPSCTF